MAKSVAKIQVQDTFEYWRQQFNNLVDNSFSVDSLYATPQSFAPDLATQQAITAGLVDATQYFLAAKSQDKAVFVPAGNYLLTQNIDGSNKFVHFGGVRFKTDFTCTFAYGLGPILAYFNKPVVLNSAPTLGSHATNKTYVDAADAALGSGITSLSTSLGDEIKNRKADVKTLTDAISLSPAPGNWWRGITRVGSDGVTEIGRIIDFHGTNETAIDFDVRISYEEQTLGKGLRFTSAGSNHTIFFNLTNGIIHTPFYDRSKIDTLTNTVLIPRQYLDDRLDERFSEIVSPVPTNWFQGYVEVKADGGSEVGRYIDLHVNSTSPDYDIRISTAKGSDPNRTTSWGGPADFYHFEIFSKDAEYIQNHGRFPNFLISPTDGSYQLNTGRQNLPFWLGGFAFRQAAVIPDAEFDWANDGRGGFSSKQYLNLSCLNDGGGAHFRALQRGDAQSASLYLEGIRNAPPQNDWNYGAVNINAARYNRPSFSQLTNEENILTVSNHTSVRFTVRGDGRVSVNGPNWNKIETGNQLTTKTYVDGSITNGENRAVARAVSDTNSTWVASAGFVGVINYSNTTNVTIGDNSGQNYNFIYPPQGFNIYNLQAFTVSIHNVAFAGGVNGDDTLFARYSVEHQNGRVRIWGGNSEQRYAPTINYLGIWRR